MGNFCFRFLRNPAELKNIKNISLLRQQMSPTRLNQITPLLGQDSLGIKHEMLKHEMIKPEPMDPELDIRRKEEDAPTDLSMDGPTDLSSNSTRHVTIVCAPDTPIMRIHPPQHFFASDDDKKDVNVQM